MRTYSSDYWDVVLTTGMDWYTSVYDSNQTEYDEWFGKRGHWVGISKHVLHAITLKVLTYETHNFLFCSNLSSADEPVEYNLCLDYICEEQYHFIILFPVRDKKVPNLSLLVINHP